MKRFVLFMFLVAIASSLAVTGQKTSRVYNRLTKTWYDYPVYTIRQIQEVPYDSLVVADSIQNTIPGRAPMQYSPYNGDTVTVIALCMVPWDIIRYTQCGYTMELADTGASHDPWGGILVRCTADYATHETDGFKNVSRGQIIQMTGQIQEFPVSPITMISSGQLQPIPGIPILIVGSQEIPPPPVKTAADFYLQGNPRGNVHYSTGEPYEGIVVELHNLTVDGYVNYARGTFNMNDGNGNQISIYDWSKWFTLQLVDAGTGCDHKDPTSTYTRPPIGITVDTIRGVITTSSGGENIRGYRIAPLYPGDIVYGTRRPTMSTHRRNPIHVNTGISPQISARVIIGSALVDWVRLYYRTNFSTYTTLDMTYDPVDTSYKASIPSQPLGTLVSYFMEVKDLNGFNYLYASAHTQEGSDTSKGTFFYKVLQGGPTIYDVQYTPFLNGYSSLLGDTVILRGVVTADTNSLLKAGLTTFGTYPYYIQNGSGAWSGVWAQAPESLMHGIINGDSIAVRGRVGEGSSVFSIVTRIYSIDSVAKITSGNPLPEPVTKPTGDFGPATDNGSPTAEPYEGVLTRFKNLTVTDIWPYYSDPTVYAVDDGSGPVRVRRDGLNSYTNQPGDTTGKVLLTLGERIDTLIGIMYSSARDWLVVPRTNADYKMGKLYQVSNRWNMVSVPRLLLDYTKTVVYPNPPAVSPAYTYETGYSAKDILANTIGYWVKFAGNNDIRYSGVRILQDTVNVKRGWNMIGSITDSVEISSIEQIPPNNVKSQYFAYRGGYSSSTVIEGGRAYWVKVDYDGQLVLKHTTMFLREPAGQDVLTLMNSISISDRNQNTQVLYFGPSDNKKITLDSYVMPPLPPTGGFDARYTSNRMLEIYQNQLSSPLDYPIKLTSAAYPISITLSLADKDVNKSYSISCDGKSYQLTAAGPLVIKSVKNDRIVLSVRNSDLPKEFALNQNYPNPFNPTTKLTFAVPQTAKVEIVVFDILGRKVKTLINEEKSAGYHQVEWNGTSESNRSVSTGVYFVRMISDKFNTVRKIMMMK